MVTDLQMIKLTICRKPKPWHGQNESHVPGKVAKKSNVKSILCRGQIKSLSSTYFVVTNDTQHSKNHTATKCLKILFNLPSCSTKIELLKPHFKTAC